VKIKSKFLDKYYIVENSWLARLGRIFMKSKNLALVLGKGIHLSGVSKDIFLKDVKWVKHELVHIHQYEKHGIVKFLLFYAIESLRKGYYNNRFEKEAREGEEKEF
jgi:hypothetical protein